MLKPSEIEATHMDSQIVSIEFQIIGTEFEEWTVLDSLSFSALLG